MLIDPQTVAGRLPVVQQVREDKVVHHGLQLAAVLGRLGVRRLLPLRAALASRGALHAEPGYELLRQPGKAFNGHPL